MRALVTADWHLTDNPRDSYRWDFVEKQLPKILQEEDVSLLLFLGDATEAKSGHSAELVNRLVATFTRLASLCPVIGLTGNHDGLIPDTPFWAFLAELKNVSWVQKPTPLRLVARAPAGSSVADRTLLLPNTRTPDRDWEDIDFKKYDWVFAHQCFATAKSESGHALSGTSLSFFPKHTKIIAGDIHRPQTSGPLTYVGSPYQVDFGDDFEPRVLIWDGKSTQSLRVSGPQKRLVEASSLKELAAVKVNKGDIVKVRYDIESYDQWPVRKHAIELWAAERGVVLHLAQPVIASSGAAPKAGSLVGSAEAETLSDEEILKAYGKKRDVNDAYVSTGLKLL